MSTSLRDQLVKAGLASKNEARNAAKQQRKRTRQKGGGEDERERERAARQAQAAKVARDRELNLQRKAAAEKKARKAEMRQLIESHRAPPADGDESFNFVDGGKVRRLPVTADQRPRISSGELVIVRHGRHYALVPPAIAERIRASDADRVVELGMSTDTPEPDANDPYKDYVVPDDLVW